MDRKKADINYGALAYIIGWPLLFLAILPTLLWVCLDLGFDLHLGYGRVYAIWCGFLGLLVVGLVAYYWLWPEDKQRPTKGSRNWKQL